MAAVSGGGAVADLFTLLQDLGERIANKDGDPSSSSKQDESDPVEERFRALMPSLLEGYFVPNRGVRSAWTFEIILAQQLCNEIFGMHYKQIDDHHKSASRFQRSC
jgi:hypothetical protein